MVLTVQKARRCNGFKQFCKSPFLLLPRLDCQLKSFVNETRWEKLPPMRQIHIRLPEIISKPRRLRLPRWSLITSFRKLFQIDLKAKTRQWFIGVITANRSALLPCYCFVEVQLGLDEDVQCRELIVVTLRAAPAIRQQRRTWAGTAAVFFTEWFMNSHLPGGRKNLQKTFSPGKHCYFKSSSNFCYACLGRCVNRFVWVPVDWAG